MTTYHHVSQSVPATSTNGTSDAMKLVTSIQ